MSQRKHPLQELCNGLRYNVRTGVPWEAGPWAIAAVVESFGLPS